MPTIKVSQETYDYLVDRMKSKLLEEIKNNPQEILNRVTKSKYGISFDKIIYDMIKVTR